MLENCENGVRVIPGDLLSPGAGPKGRLRQNAQFVGRRSAVTTLALLAALGFATATAGLPAFPGAEGGGALAVGGRGGEVCKVTNLADSGPGSLRDCVEREGPRTVIFLVGGTIKLDSSIQITKPYLTIAGQTAPGGGIQIKANKDAPSQVGTLIRVQTHEVIIRYLRLRPGNTGYRISAANNREWAGGGGGVVENVIWDHVSLSWAFGGTNWSLWSSSSGLAPRNITLQNSLLAEGRVNLLTGGNGSLGSTDVDFHNNLLANASHRNPLLKIATSRFVNNIVYNWSGWAARTVTGAYVDWIGNLFKPGPHEKSSSRANPEIMAVRYTEGMESSVNPNLSRDPSIFVVGNWGLLSGMDPETDNFPFTREAGPEENSTIIGPIPLSWKRDRPLAEPLNYVPISVRHAAEIEPHILPIVGASQRLDCSGNWQSNRDAVDARIIDEYLDNRGSASIDHEDDVGGYPVLPAGVPCKDTSGDGIPDDWALTNGLDPADPTLAGTVHESGYTYLELYLNGMQIEQARARPEEPSLIKVE